MKLGIDIGGSTVRVAVFENGKAAKRFSVSMPSNLNSDKGAALNLQAALKEHGIRYAELIGCAMAGGGEKENVREIRNALLHFTDNAVVVPDTEAVHYAFFGEGNDIIVIVGTGMSIFGKNDRNTIQFDGLGYALSDVGSGFWIAKEFLKQGLEDLQLNKDTAFSKGVSAYFKTNSVYNILQRVYKGNVQANIADLSTLIFKNAALENATKEIINQGVSEVIEGIRKVKETLKLNKASVGIYGGVFAHSEIFKNNIVQRLKSMGIQIANSYIPITDAAVELAEKRRTDET